MKVLNIKGIMIVVLILGVIHLASGLFLSPVLTPMLLDVLNKNTNAKISVGKVNVWPLTLTATLSDLKVFDPDNVNTRIALIQKASFRLSPLGLLAKRAVIADLTISGADINLVGEADGSFNIEKLAKAPGAPAGKPGIFGKIEKKDLFSKIYDSIKEKARKGKEARAAGKAKSVIKKEVKVLPHGRRVTFRKPADDYMFEIQFLAIKDSKVNFKASSGDSIDINKVRASIRGLKMDPETGASMSGLGIGGVLNKNGSLSGSFELDYATKGKYGDDMVFNMSARDIDLPALKFIYKNSLPVDFVKGRLTLSSRTSIVDGALDSADSVTLEGHSLTALKQDQMIGFIPLPVLCDALNKVDPVKLRFEITGTVDKPQFKGVEESLIEIAKPYIGSMADDLKKQGLNALEGLINKKGQGEPAKEGEQSSNDTAQKALDAFKSLLGGEEKK